jgi:hypothetical protein
MRRLDSRVKNHFERLSDAESVLSYRHEKDALRAAAFGLDDVWAVGAVAWLYRKTEEFLVGTFAV